MFMTLKCSRGAEGGIKHVDTSGSFNRPREYYSSIACSTCRSKKLGCSREKSGCRRCQSRGELCVYEPPRHRGKKSQKQSTPPPNTESTQSPRDDPVNASPALQPTAMVPGNTIRATVADSCDQHATVNLAPQHLSADAAKQSAMTESAYSSCSDSDFLSVDFMPELINFSDDVLMPCLPETPQAPRIEYNGSYQPNASAFTVDPLSYEPTNASKKVPGSPMDLVSPIAVSSGLSRSASASEQIYDEENCDCTGIALRLLEETISAPKLDEWQGTERKLYFLKTAISECAALFECSCLQHDSGLSMLVVVVYEKLQFFFEDISESTGHRLDQSRSNPQASPGNWGRSHVGQDDGSQGRQRLHSQPRPNLTIGHYHIDTREEHFNVMSALVLLQLRRLAALVSKLKRNAADREWNAHVSLLRNLVHRMKSLSATLQR
ncbi:hypothetical protein LMH87_003797 [Akanthomyces muscarius]|uniref:Zn(2)-C6 fungal-type domain-containing protein n=1 Tax=Akanthomyces muscarius TaxID=2231603 RepID=A0A9W8UHA4_AKAMU|nr:hypothetical protein LMH87_003797 [Akanthomyces muscarius]KAJ4144930.1 hypothetical protein LMH87_003797 [Akanthomyces muscarius]